MCRNELCLEKCKKKHLGKIVKTTDSQWEELSSNMKLTAMQTNLIKASIVATFTVPFKKFCGINILVITVLAEISL